VPRGGAGAGVAAVHSLASPPNPGFADQWSLQNTGQLGGTPGDDVDAPRAWDLVGTGSGAILVGSVDSGVAYDLPALAGLNLWTDPDDPPNGIDDDHDGCVDDADGCDVVDGGGAPLDANGHGTATASVMVGPWTTANPYAGIAPGSTLIVARATDAHGNGTTGDVAAAIDFVAGHGARVVNISLAAPKSDDIHHAIVSHPDTLFVAAAGNAASDDDDPDRAVYPCADPAPNVICVAASTPNDGLASYSNWGAQSVDLAAPGYVIAAPSLTGGTATWDGTSLSAPMVSGATALLLAERPGATVAELKAALLDSVEQRPAFAGRTVTGGRLDIYDALMRLVGEVPAARPAPPAPPPDPRPPLTAPPLTPSAPGPGPLVTTPATSPTNTPTASAASRGRLLKIGTRATRHGSRAIRVTMRDLGGRAVTGRVAVVTTHGGVGRAARFRLRARQRATVVVPASLRPATRRARLVVRAGTATLRPLVRIAPKR